MLHGDIMSPPLESMGVRTAAFGEQDLKRMRSAQHRVY